jgi:hypothetical protein
MPFSRPSHIGTHGAHGPVKPFEFNLPKFNPPTPPLPPVGWMYGSPISVSVNPYDVDIDSGAVIFPALPPIAYDEDLSHFVDVRQQQDDDPWHTFFFVPVAPPNLGWDDWDWNKFFGASVSQQDDEPWHTFFTIPGLAYDETDGQRFIGTNYSDETTEEDTGLLPIIPTLAWDEVDWQKFWGLTYSKQTTEEDTGLLPIVTYLAYEEDLSHSVDVRQQQDDEPWQTFFTIPGLAYEEDQSKNVDVRQQQDDEPWQTFFTIPTPPPNLGWDDWDWNKSFDNRVSQQDDEPWQAFFTIPGLAYEDTEGQKNTDKRWSAQEEDLGSLPIIPILAWDEVDWQKFWGFGYSNQTQEQDTGLFPIIPGLAYDEDPSRSTDVRQQQDDEPWHTFFFIPVAPPTLGWDDWDWCKAFQVAFSGQTVEEDINPLPFISPFVFEEFNFFSGDDHAE